MRPNYPIEGVVYPEPAAAERYHHGGAWSSVTAADALRAAAIQAPDKCALVCEGQRLTYEQFDTGSDNLAAALLDLGLNPGDRALFQMGSVIETAIAVLACAKAGIIPVCTLPQHRAIEITALAERSQPRAYFVQADFSAFDLVQFASDMASRQGIPHLIVARGHMRANGGYLEFERLIGSQASEQARARLAAVEVSIGDVLMFQLSGGSTNVPKIIPRFNGEFLGLAAAWARRTSMDADSIVLYALPLIHTAGLVSVLYPSILLCGSCVLIQRMDAKAFFTLVEREHVTHSMSIGPAATQMLDYDGIRNHDLSSLQLLTNFHGSEVMERHVGVPCLNIFGIGEGLIMSSEIGSSEDIRYNTVGWPLSPFDDVRLLEPGTERDARPGELGELCFRGPSRTCGYFGMPEVNRVSFTSDGLFRTGDVMMSQVIGEQRCYSFRGRIKDNINRGGEKFGAEEVEVIIGRHPHVLEAKVVAMPDRVYGEKACAFLIMSPGARLLTVKELGEFLVGEGLAKFKLPERIESIADFPVTRVGKVDKQALRDLIVEIFAREQSETSVGAGGSSAPPAS